MEKHRIDRRKILAGMAVAPAIMGLGRFSGVSAQDNGSDLSVTIRAHDFSFDVPEEVSAGFTTLTMINEGEEDHHAQVVRLNDGVSVDDFMAGLQEGPAGIFPLISFHGGPGVVPGGGEQTVIQELTPGTHMLLCFIESPDDGVPHLAKGMIQEFAVVESDDTGEAPAADIEATMSDFAFEGVPTEVSSERQVWQVTNDGPEPHELILLKLAEGVTADDALAMLGGEAPEAEEATAEAENGDADHEEMAGPPIVAGGGIQGMDAGITGWMITELEPASYLAICFIPSPANEGMPHAALGMVSSFTVSA